MPTLNCIQNVDTSSFNPTDTILMQIDARSATTFAWSGNATTDGAAITSGLDSALGGSTYISVTWPFSTDGGISDETGGPYIEFVGALAGYDWPLMLWTDQTTTTAVNATSIQVGTNPYTTLYWLGTAAAWESINILGQGWWRDSGHVVPSSGYPGSISGVTTWEAYVSDGGTNGNVPAAQAAAVDYNLIDTTGVTATNPYLMGGNQSINGGGVGVLTLGPPSGTSVSVFQGSVANGGATVTVNAASIFSPYPALGTDVAITLNDSGVFACSYDNADSLTHNASGITITANDSSTVCGVYSSAGNTGATPTLDVPIVLNGSSVLAACAGGGDNSLNSLTVAGTVSVAGTASIVINAGSSNYSNTLALQGNIAWNSTTTTDLGDTAGMSGTLTFAGGIDFNYSTSLTIGDGNAVIDTTSGAVNFNPQSNTVSLQVVTPDAIFNFDTSDITGGGGGYGF